MAQFEKANKIWGWSIRYNFTTMLDKIQTVASCDLATIRALYPSLTGDAWASGFLKEWKIYAEINSLAEAPFPNLSDSLSESERLSAVLNVEWGSPRFHYCVWSTAKTNPSNDPATGDWNLEGKSSLINSFGYPYRIYYPFDMLSNNLAREFAEGFKFGFSIEDVGYGYPQANDIIVSSGNWTQELISLVANPQPVNIYVTGGSSGSTTPAVTLLTITSAPQSEYLLNSSTAITFTIGNATANQAITIEVLKGTTVVKTDSLTITSGTTGTYSLVPSSVKANGGGFYKIKATQGTLGAETVAFVLRDREVQVMSTSLSIAANTSFNIRYWGLPSGTAFKSLWQYKSGTTWSNVLNSDDYTFTPVTNETYHQASQTSGRFTYGMMTGYQGPGTYRIMYFAYIESQQTPSFQVYSNEVTITA